MQNLKNLSSHASFLRKLIEDVLHKKKKQTKEDEGERERETELPQGRDSFIRASGGIRCLYSLKVPSPTKCFLIIKGIGLIYSREG